MFRPGNKSGYQGRYEIPMLDEDFPDDTEDGEDSQPRPPRIPPQYRRYDQEGEEEESTRTTKQNKAAHIHKYEKWFVVGFSGVVDITQIALNAAVGSGVIINRFVDIAYGIILGGYASLRGLMKPKVAISIIVALIGEEVPLLDVAPFWSGDAVYIFYSNDGDLPIKVPGVSEIPGVSKIAGKIPWNVDGVRLPVKK